MTDITYRAATSPGKTHTRTYVIAGIGALVAVVLLAIAGTLAVVFRWETIPGPRDNMLGEPTAIRVDRWTGTVVKCGVEFTTAYAPGPKQKLECAE